MAPMKEVGIVIVWDVCVSLMFQMFFLAYLLASSSRVSGLVQEIFLQ